MAKAVVFITGRDPSQGKGGGSSYVRAHMRAATGAGFEPHVFCVDQRDDVTEEDFGVVHRVASPFMPRRSLKAALIEQPERFFAQWLAEFVVNPYMAPAHAPWLAAGVEECLSKRTGPHLIHGFYTWGCVGVAVRERLLRKGVETIVVNSFYTTAANEARAKTRGAADSSGLIERATFQAERLWINHVVKRYERRAYVKSRLVLLNYESVQRLLLAEHGAAAETRKLPYTSETAFLRDETIIEPEPEAIAALQPLDAPLVVSVSRHDPRKGIDVLIRALAEFCARGVRFRACLVSGGPLFATSRRLVAGGQRLGLAARSFAGRRRRHRLERGRHPGRREGRRQRSAGRGRGRFGAEPSAWSIGDRRSVATAASAPRPRNIRRKVFRGDSRQRVARDLYRSGLYPLSGHQTVSSFLMAAQEFLA